MKYMKKRGRVRLKRIKTWQLLVMLVLLLFVDATLLRMDHVRMTELRDEVLRADTNENDEEIIRALEELKGYVFSNIVVNVVDDNGRQEVIFGTGPFYLERQYIKTANKALAEAEATIAADNNPNGNIYQMASEVCRPQAIANGWSWDDANYINCMVGEIQKYPAADELNDTIAASLPSTELYRKDYASPVWAPSWAGWMILVTIVVIVVIFIRGIKWAVLRLSLLISG